MRKIALLICVFMVLSVSVLSTVGLADSAKAVSLRVEGITNTIASSAAGYTTTALTAWDAAKELLDSKNIPYNFSMSDFYGTQCVYISSINGDAAATFGGYDGWMYVVNGVAPSEGAANLYNIKNGDDIVFYYGDFAPGTLVPKVIISDGILAGQQFTVEMQSTYDEYDTNWNPIPKTVEIQGVNIHFNDMDYVTAADGKVILNAPASPGDYVLSYSKQSAGSVPAIVRGTVNLNIQGLLPTATPVSPTSSAIPTAIPTGEPTPAPLNTPTPVVSAILTIGNAVGKPGDTVDIPISITGNIGVSAFGFIINYDSNSLTPLSCSAGAVWDSGITYNQNYDVNQVMFAGASQTNKTGDGIIATLKFKIKDGIADGSTNLTLTVDELIKSDGGNQVNVPYNVNNGKIGVYNVIKGDVNMDGSVTPSDASEALMHYAKLKMLTESQILAADVNLDGKVTAADASLILMEYAGLIINW